MKAHSVQDFYKYFITKSPEYFIEYSQYREIVLKYFKFLSEQVIEEGRVVEIPCRLGTVRIIKHKPKTLTGDSLCVDFKSTKDLSKTIFHLNEHTRGFKYRFLWSKKEAIFINKSKYQLIMSRTNKRRLAYILKNRLRDYSEI